ncbi:Abscisic-aldehyde oxidase [Vitis vinifera]|uniref:Abscisic-aldehyde oxidase n=1 Tax=Vitis vinifera TaxID=29760 RepID=A0A438FGG2_VITVI|nr:Abscisic-aldehyde oxidase [Vitis vinifera]
MQAQSQAVNLSASSYYVPDFSSFQYLNYGAAVEVNLLTGQTTILQSDIIYDCGQSLNPAVDLDRLMQWNFFIDNTIEGAFVQGIGFFMLESTQLIQMDWWSPKAHDIQDPNNRHRTQAVQCELEVPATMPVVKELCGLENVRVTCKACSLNAGNHFLLLIESICF